MSHIRESEKKLQEQIIDILKSCYDPEIPVNIYDLGLVYDVIVDESGHAMIKMTLTSPACPVAVSLPEQVRVKVASIDGIAKSDVEVIWDPPWSPDLMSDEARLELGLM